MAKLLSGGTLRDGGSGQYITLAGAQPQLPETPTTSTGYTLVTNNLLITEYRSSLGNLEMHLGEIYNNIPNGNITLTGTGTGFVYVSRSTESTSTTTGALVVRGGVGIGDALWVEKDIHVNGLTIGQGWQGRNNISIQGDAIPQINDFNEGQESVAIGWDTLKGLSTAYKSIAIGRFALSSGTELSRSIAIGDSALKNIGIIPRAEVGLITGIGQTSPAVVTVTGHGLSTGTQVYIDGVLGMTEVNGQTYYIDVVDQDNIALYTDNILGTPLNAVLFDPYDVGGIVYRPLLRNNNIALGNNAAMNLIDGELNFFMGYNIAKNLTTGSNNFFAGHEVAQNMTQGSGNISIGGDNLVDGEDNQINIGSVFYYNGKGYLSLNADTGVGLGTVATSTTFASYITNVTSTNPVVVTAPAHGIVSGEDVVITGVVGTVEVNNNVYWARKLTNDVIELYEDPALTTSVDGTGFTAYASSGTLAKNQLFGALVVLGGLAVSENAIIKKDLTVLGTIDGSIARADNLSGGNGGSLPYQTDPNVTAFLSIGAAGQVLLSDGELPYWDDFAALNSTTATNAENVFVNAVTTGVNYKVLLGELIGDNSPVDASEDLSYDTGNNELRTPNILVNSTLTSYTAGIAEENYKVYTPKVTVSDGGVPPADPRIGDFWIDPSIQAMMQYIQDGTNRFWIQITAL